jgi:protein-S-isoprenylcysteine O-methyltransferase Ste14
MKILKHLQAIILLPVIATLIIPGTLIYMTGRVKIGWSLAPPVNLVAVIFGILFIGLGLVLVVTAISLFAIVGEGTLAPWTPTRKLVVRGVYRYVRNPMISGVFSILLGEALVFGSVPLVYWFLIFVLVNVIYIPLSEEPGLERRFGDEYVVYKRNVPRWLPRLRPWQAPEREP